MDHKQQPVEPPPASREKSERGPRFYKKPPSPMKDKIKDLLKRTVYREPKKPEEKRAP